MRHRRTISVLVACAANAPSVLACSYNGDCTTTAASVGLGGVEANSHSDASRQAFSADGRLVVFTSTATNLVAGDLNASYDCFLLDQKTGVMSLVSLNSSGAQAIYGASSPAISAGGGFVAFQSVSSNLVPGDNNNLEDIFRRDLAAGITTRVNLGPAGAEANDISHSVSISADGNLVAFSSLATNLVPGDTNGSWDVFVCDVAAGVATRVSVNSGGGEANGDSIDSFVCADGRFVVFESVATNLGGSFRVPWPRVYIHDLETGQTDPVAFNYFTGAPDDSPTEDPVVSADGRYVAFESWSPNLVLGDNNNESDIFVYDRSLSQTVRASVSSTGQEGNEYSGRASISADGRYVAFWSSASNLVPNDTNQVQDIFVRDLLLGTTVLASVGSAGVQSSFSCRVPSISPDGRVVSFESSAPNLALPAVTWQTKDVFIRSCAISEPETFCIPQTNSLGCTPAIAFTGAPSASAGSGFHVAASSIVNAKSGILFYSKASSAMTPFHGGLLCVQPPLRRTSVQQSGGTPKPAADCTGAFDLDFNAWVATGKDPGLVPGQTVWAQYWSRDPQAPSSTNLSDALTFVLGN